MSHSRFRKSAWALVIVASLAAAATVLIPAWIVQPFKPQNRQGLELSHFLRDWSPLLTIVASAVAVAALVWLWSGARWRGKAVLIVVIAITAALTWLARQNHFEWMFNPLPEPAYAKLSEADFLDDKDMVIAVEKNGEAAAYPVRQLAYHHVVHDVVGGVPIVVTY